MPYVGAPNSISPLLVIPVAKSDEKIIIRKADVEKCAHGMRVPDHGGQ
jgi:hypothetical protein